VTAPLVIEFCGELTEVEPGQDLTFGRAADLVVDENPHLHRVLGRLQHWGGLWWLTNEGRSITMVVADEGSRSSAIVAPGSRIALTFRDAAIRFRAGVTDYALFLRVPAPAEPGVPADDDTLVDGAEGDDESYVDTIGIGDLPLTDEQRLLLIALAEPALRDPHGGAELPANRAVAHRLGWSITKFNRKLDNLCNRFSAAGIGGLRGSVDQLATDRRRRLVDHAIESGLVTEADLGLLPP
jgi:hypothetical protein